MSASEQASAGAALLSCSAPAPLSGCTGPGARVRPSASGLGDAVGAGSGGGAAMQAVRINAAVMVIRREIPQWRIMRLYHAAGSLNPTSNRKYVLAILPRWH